MSLEASVPLQYTIAQCQAHSGRYVAENIIHDSPNDLSSRWSGPTKHFILLRLTKQAVLKGITFGKYSKAHPCNMKEFKVYGGLDSSRMTEILHSGLKNDSISETFPIRHVNNAGVYFPTRYVKIVPLSTHGPSFNASIWHIALIGVVDEKTMGEVTAGYDEYRETIALRYILKHLRQRRLLTPFQDICTRSGIQLEHPLISKLYDSIVLQGDWACVESLLQTISRAGLFDEFIQSCQPRASWIRLRGTDANGDTPSPRGGHAMCIDPVEEKIYMLGGYDGRRSLDDFWVYHIKEDRWEELCHSTGSQQNAPGPRSCHKMVFDSKSGSIYVLGRLSDTDAANETSSTKVPIMKENEKPYCSEFYRYHTRGADAGKWDFLSFDTAASGGPPLVFDHQMAMDLDEQIIYVFGGRVLDGDRENIKYSGLYSYNIRRSKWFYHQPADIENSTYPIVIPPRFGHSMVLDSKTHMLYIFAGQRDDRYLSDMYAYNVATNTATEIFSDFTASKGPNPCFTQRAVIDPSIKEIYVFCGLTRQAQTTILPVEQPHWVYRYDSWPGSWTPILSNLSNKDQESPTHRNEEPIARYAHQVVYNPRTKTAYLHGGNAGVIGVPDSVDELATPTPQNTGREKRLSDLWELKFQRPKYEEIIRRAKFRIRRQQFREMAEDDDPIKALKFLQSDVGDVVNKTDPVEDDTFRSLLNHLTNPAPPTTLRKSMRSAAKNSRTISDHEDSPPRKRSKSGSASVLSGQDIPQDGVSHGEDRTHNLDPDGEDADGEWTSSINIGEQIQDDEENSDLNKNGGGDHEDGDDNSLPGGKTLSHLSNLMIDAHELRAIQDPLELLRHIDHESDAKTAPSHPDPKVTKQEMLSAERFEQRTEVFESLLEFVAKSAKQPSGSLLNLIDNDDVGKL